MATEDDFAHIWYADGNGNITGYVVNGGDKASTIIDAYNEHFGTDISIWTPEKKTLQVGDTVPDWNAYEKIEMPPQGEKLKVYYKGSYVVGYDNNNEFRYYKTNEGAALFNSEGVVVSSENIGSDFNREISESLSFGGYDDVPVPIQNDVSIGWKVESWSEFKEV